MFLLIAAIWALPRPLGAQPAGSVLGLAIRPSVRHASSLFTSDGERQSRLQGDEGSWWALATGLVLSYGLSDTAAIRVAWLPGFTFPSGYADDQTQQRNGASNLTLQVPLLLLSTPSGPGDAEDSDGLFGASPVGITAIPTAVIKIRGYDFEAQADRRQAGETYIAEHPDRKAHAAGLALAEEMPLGRRAHLLSSQQVLFYFPADYDEQSLANYDRNVIRDRIEDADPFDTIYYRYRLSGTLGGSYVLQEAPRTRWRTGLTVKGHYMPAPIVDDILVENTDSFMVAAEPAISVSPTVWNHRTSFELSWSIPLFGKNEDATHEIALALRTTLYSPSGDDPQADDAGAGE